MTPAPNVCVAGSTDGSAPRRLAPLRRAGPAAGRGLLAACSPTTAVAPTSPATTGAPPTTAPAAAKPAASAAARRRGRLTCRGRRGIAGPSRFARRGRVTGRRQLARRGRRLTCRRVGRVLQTEGHHRLHPGADLARPDRRRHGVDRHDPARQPVRRPGPPRRLGQTVGSLARTWDVSPDGTVVTFHLVTGAKWHDGSPFTAQDVKFSWERAADADTAATQSARDYWAPVKSVDVPDDARSRSP